MLIAWVNRADAAAISTDSEKTTQPASSVQEEHVAKKWGTATGVASAYLIFDMGSSVACDVVALLGTNLSADATIRVRSSDSDPTVTSSLELDTGVDPAGVDGDYGAAYASFASTTSRYWRIDLDDPSAEDNLLVGRVFLGPSWTPAVGMSLGVALAWVDPSEHSQSYGGQVHVGELPQRRMLSFTLDFMEQDEAMEQAFELQRAAGRRRDVLVVPDIAGSYLSEESVWGLLEAVEPIVNDRLGIYRQKFTVVERL